MIWEVRWQIINIERISGTIMDINTETIESVFAENYFGVKTEILRHRRLHRREKMPKDL